MNPLAQHFLNILRISPNEVQTENPSSQPKTEDDASSFLKGKGVTLSDSQGNELPIFFEKANEEGTHYIIKTKASSPITVDGDLVLHNSLLTTNTLKVGDLNYPASAPVPTPTDNNNITWVMGGTKSNLKQLELKQLEWFDLDAKFETVKDKLINDGMSVHSIPENVILYHAMPYKRFMFYKTYIDENGKGLPTLEDFILCDGNGNTPNLYREDPTFIRGLNFAYAYKNDKGEPIKNYIHDEMNNAVISLNADTNEFKIGYYEVIDSNEDIQGNECNYYPKNIKDIGIIYPATTNYLTPKLYNHRHLLFTGLSGETDLPESTDNQPSMCTFTTIAEEDSFTPSTPKGYEPLFSNTTNDDWDKYCSGENNYFHGLLPIPTSDSIEAGIHPISKTGFIPFEYHHKIKADDKKPLIKQYTGKYELHGIEEEEEDNNSLLYNSKYTEVPNDYIWRSVTSLPIFLEQTEDKISINTNVMHKEEEPKKPNPTFINLLPLMCKPKTNT